MLSGIGDETELKRLGNSALHHLPGVFEYRTPMPPRSNGSEATIHAASHTGRASPDILMCQGGFLICTQRSRNTALPKTAGLSCSRLPQPKSKRRVRLVSAERVAPPQIFLNVLSDPKDIEVARVAFDLSRELGASALFRELNAREVLPGDYYSSIDEFIRQNAEPY